MLPFAIVDWTHVEIMFFIIDNFYTYCIIHVVLTVTRAWLEVLLCMLIVTV